MYNCSDYFKNNFHLKQHHIRGTVVQETSGTIIATAFDENNIVSDSFSISSQAVSSETFELGAICTKTLNVSLVLPAIRAYALMRAKITAEVGIETDTTGVYEYIPMGSFFITEAKKKRDYIEISASDIIGFANCNDDEENPPTSLFDSTVAYTPYTIASMLCTYANIPLGNTADDFPTLPTYPVTAENPEPITFDNVLTMGADTEIKSTTDLLGYLAQCLCSFVTTDRNGNVFFKQFTSHIDQNNIQNYSDRNKTALNSTAIADFQLYIAKCYGFCDDGQVFFATWFNPAGEPTNTDLVLDNNPFYNGYYGLQTGTPQQRIDAMEKLVTPLAYVAVNVKWTPFELNYYGMPWADAGDSIQVENYDGTTELSTISHTTYRFRNTQSIKCAGSDTRLLLNVRTKEKRLSDIFDKKVLRAKGLNVTETEFGALTKIEGQTYYIVDGDA